MEIVVYDCRITQNSASNKAVSVAVPQETLLKAESVYSLSKLSRFLGYNLLVLAMAGIALAVSPALIKEFQFRFKTKIQEKPVIATFTQILSDEEITKRALANQEAKGYGVSTDFSIVIPKISAAAKIVPNVHPGDKEEYLAALKQGVAHASGSAFPGQKGTIFLFSHSTNAQHNVERFNAIFYLLKELENQDKIIIFYAGQKFTYLVVNKQTVAADNTNWLTDDSEEEKLVLQTCWPPGTSLKRLIVIAKPA